MEIAAQERPKNLRENIIIIEEAESTITGDNIVVEANIHDKKVTVVGFENHGGQTKAVSNPFGKVLVGHGNTFDSGFEGYMDAQTIATYIHGPLLPKNPDIADEVILRGLKRRYTLDYLEPLQDSLEHAAHDAMLKRLNVK